MQLGKAKVLENLLHLKNTCDEYDKQLLQLQEKIFAAEEELDAWEIEPLEVVDPGGYKVATT